jgi:transcriptional antiterminator
VNLSSDEQLIFDLLKKKEQVSLDELMKHFECTRHSLTGRIRDLNFKTAAEGWVIVNVGGIGRGNKAIYKMEKKF